MKNLTMNVMVLFYLILVVAVCPTWAISSPVIKTLSGTFQGTRLTAKNGNFYNGFRGIPYAKPPVGDLRFRPPVAVAPIDGVYDATYFRPYCIQMNFLPNDFDLGQEDCLYLNVFTPRHADRDDGELKKVFVFFHGGANFNGFPDCYIPGTLVTEHDVIVVTVAYRLGYLGLLSTMSPGCQGNFYLQDQLLSLVWVKQNIEHFGGDPNGITIGGESAGGIDSSFLSLTSGSRDLFARAYCQSGTTGVRYSHLITNPRPLAIKLGRQLGCIKDDQSDPVSEQDFDQMVDCLRLVPAIKFSLTGLSGEIPPLYPVLYGDLFPKKIEELFSDESYLSSIKFFERDYLVGLNQNEGGTMNLINDQIFATIPEDVKKTLPPNFLLHNMFRMFMTPVVGPVSQTVLEKVMKYYEDNNEYGMLADFSADVLFHIMTLQYVTAAAAERSSKDSRVYLFEFFHDLEWHLGPYKGMLHGLDLLYLFDLDISTIIKIIPLKVNSSKWNEKDDRMKQKFTTLVADFIKTGNPGRSLKDELPSGWPGFDKTEQQYLKLGLTSEIKHHMLPERVALWSEQIPKWISEFPVTEEKRDEL